MIVLSRRLDSPFEKVYDAMMGRLRSSLLLSAASLRRLESSAKSSKKNTSLGCDVRIALLTLIVSCICRLGLFRLDVMEQQFLFI